MIAQLIKNPPAVQETLVQPLGREDPLENGQAAHSSIPGLPRWLSWSRIRLQCRRPGLDPWVGKISWRRERLLFQYSSLENSMDCIVQGVAKSRTRLSDFGSQGPTVQNREVYLAPCRDLHGEESERFYRFYRITACTRHVCGRDSLCCIAETNTTL